VRNRDDQIYFRKNFNLDNSKRAFPLRGAFEVRCQGLLVYSKVLSNVFPNLARLTDKVLSFYKDLEQGLTLEGYLIDQNKAPYIQEPSKQGMSSSNWHS